MSVQRSPPQGGGHKQNNEQHKINKQTIPRRTSPIQLPSNEVKEDLSTTEQKIIELEKTIKLLLSKVDDLDLTCNLLKKENDSIKEENQNLKKTMLSKPKPPQTVPDEFVTDEDELAQETDWNLKLKRPNK